MELYLSMEGEMRQRQVRGHRLLRVGLLVGALLLLERHRFLRQRRIVRLVVGASHSIMMRMIGDETAVHSGLSLSPSPSQTRLAKRGGRISQRNKDGSCFLWLTRQNS